jgi:alpha-galactosidase
MLRRVFILLLCALLTSARFAFSATVIQAQGDASIAHDTQAGTWIVSAGGATLTAALDPSSDWQIVSLVSPTGHNWISGTVPDTWITANGSTYAFGNRAAGFTYTLASTTTDGRHLELDASFALQKANLTVTRHVAVVSGSPTFELWTTFQATGATVSVANIGAMQVVIAPGTVHYLTGHAGDPGDTTFDSAFAQRQQSLSVGDTLTLGGPNRSSEETVPWFTVDGTGDEFYAGLMWSGGWSLTAAGRANGIEVAWGLSPMSTNVGATSVEGPHVLIGMVKGSGPDASAAIKSFIVNSIRQGQPFTPLVTYNTWFAYGTDIDETTMRAEMDHAAALGAELFVIDAGWYTGADTAVPSDFDQGLGTWQVDPARFPSGMAALKDYAHGLGMKFGIWVEPERVNRSVIGEDGLDESAIATAGGDYQSADSGQICLAGAAGRQWVVDHLTALLDAVQPDYLKWDNNLWVNCDRAGHGHGTADGNFAHVTALYQILAALRQRYPNLVVENCSQGGNRLDFAMLRYTDTAWMDDRTAPSVHVRHNIEGLSGMFPPAYLLSFVTNHEGESIEDAQDLSLYFRSRMTGLLGLCFLGGELSDDDTAAIQREIATYKSARSTLSDGSAALLSPQAEFSNGPAWDVLQETSVDGGVLLYAFENGGAGSDSTNVTPKDLQPGVTYTVQSADVGALGEATGADLMAHGIAVKQSPTSASHLLILTPES